MSQLIFSFSVVFSLFLVYIVHPDDICEHAQQFDGAHLFRKYIFNYYYTLVT